MDEVVQTVQGCESLELVGIHCHIGSTISVRVATADSVVVYSQPICAGHPCVPGRNAVHGVSI